MSERRLERAYPWIAGTLALILAVAFVKIGTYERAVEKLTAPLITLSGVAFGFLLTFAGLLTSMDRSSSIQELREVEAYPILLSYVKESMYLWGSVAVTTIFLALTEKRLLDPFLARPWLWWIGVLLTGLITAGLFSSHRVVRILFALLRSNRRRQRQGREAA